MIIHIVQTGETIETIALQYQIPVSRIVEDNGLSSGIDLVPGQTIVIVYPEQIYTVKEGDTLEGIADANGISLIQLLRNNPFLSDREFIYPGETLVISYKHPNGRIAMTGFATSFIDKRIFKKTLPFLTYLTVFGYRVTENAEIVGIDDTEMIKMAKDYNVAPIMFATALTPQGVGSQEIAYRILYNEELVDHFINEALNLLTLKGYYGINITFQFITPENLQIYNNFCTKLYAVLHPAGFKVFITFSPRLTFENNFYTFEKIDYSYIGNLVDGVYFMFFNFGYAFGPPAPVASVQMMRDLSDYLVQIIPSDKITMGLSVIGYDWKLPYVSGVTKANALSYVSAIQLASEVDVNIDYDETSMTPFYHYIEKALPINHMVWFVDARSVDGTAQLIPDFKLNGISIWNIMYYYTQQWVILNSQYVIDTVL